MNFSKKINLKLVLIGIVFMGLLILTNGVLMKYALEKSAESTYNTHYKEAEKILNQEIYILKDIARKIAVDKNLVGILNNNRSIDDLTEEEIKKVTEEITYIQDYLKDLIFIDGVSIINIPGKYLFYSDKLIETPSYFENYKLENFQVSKDDNEITTGIYIDPITREYKFSVISFIYSDESNETLGVIVLDILLDNLVKDINSKFYMGELNSYIKIDDNTYYCSDGIVNNIDKKRNEHVIKMNNVLDDKIDIFLEFDKDSIIYNKNMKGINRVRILIFSILVIMYVSALVALIRRTFKPILNSLDKLKIVLKNLDNKDLEFERLDEFEQLEVVSNSLGASIDKKIKSFIYHDELT